MYSVVVPIDDLGFECGRSEISKLILHDGLYILNCWGNKLTELSLNNELVSLICQHNQLTELTLNDKLVELICDMDVNVSNINNNWLCIEFLEI